MNNTGNIAINPLDALLRNMEPACRWEPMLANRNGTECAPEFWL
jgi:hypothetical protein